MNNLPKSLFKEWFKEYNNSTLYSNEYLLKKWGLYFKSIDEMEDYNEEIMKNLGWSNEQTNNR